MPEGGGLAPLGGWVLHPCAIDGTSRKPHPRLPTLSGSRTDKSGGVITEARASPGDTDGALPVYLNRAVRGSGESERFTRLRRARP
jgi:hypothetical protein